ncbi:hypothetical protein ABT186_30975 [Streptomyces sp. NPDC001634]|uniref:hypothetical protein n=1 Tax=Streptomyces sp. NPDC001634 TaxID=3154390 RepID=UPI0033275083
MGSPGGRDSGPAVSARTPPRRSAAPQHLNLSPAPTTGAAPAPGSLVLFSPGCSTGPDGEQDCSWQCRLPLDWRPQEPDGTREARLSRRGAPAGTLRVDPPRPGLVARLWRTVRFAATFGRDKRNATSPVNRYTRHAVLSLNPVPAHDTAPDPLHDDLRTVAGEWHVLLTPVGRTEAGTTVAVAHLPVTCPECNSTRGGGICLLLPLPGGQEP